MDEEGFSVSGSYLVISEKKSDSLYPMIFGVSCAFFALRLMPQSELNDEKWLEIRNRMLQGSAHLLGLLVWRIQREEAKTGKCELLRKLGREIEELKKRRSEDAKANEKVVGIFAAHEQGWFRERKKLRQQIGALLNELRVLEMTKEESISKLNEELLEKDLLMKSKDMLLEEEEQKRIELEENFKRVEKVVDELRETAKREAQDHSNELRKHKTAFIEVVSTRRQLEADMGRAVRQVEAAKQELVSVLEQKEEFVLMTQKLSMELIKTRNDLDQKDKILSTILRKSKLDTAEKQALLKVKLSKSKRKQAELETERWKAVSESRHERNSLRSMLSKHANSKLEAFLGERGVHCNKVVPSHIGKTRSRPTNLLKYEQPEGRKQTEVVSPLSELYMTEGTEEIVFAADVKQLEGWVRSEAEKYAAAIEQRHHHEIQAFAEQLRLKDEKLEAFRWRLLSMELESKRLQSHIKGLDHDLSLLRQDNLKLEALLFDRESELHSLKMIPPNSRKANLNSSSHDLAIAHDTVWSRVKIIKRKPEEKVQETTSVEISQGEENVIEEEIPIKNQSNDIVLPKKECEEGNEVSVEPGFNQEEWANTKEIENADKLLSPNQSLTKKMNSPWKMDLHALGVSYKIKRLKQQLLMFERLTGKQESCEDSEISGNGHFGIKGFYILMSLLNKQVSRYLSLQGKADDLCKRMHENNLDVNHGGPSVARTKEESKILEHFLEETFQLQRYIVATGQKLMKIQSKIASGFVGAAEELDDPASFDTKKLADSLRTLFREVQRGLEVRIARIIGDLERTLACEGIIHLRK